MKSTTLYFREGSSDKVYQAAIEPRNNLFVVTFAYGRRGATLQTGTKTQKPVDLPTAEHVFDKLVREKTAKGYTPAESGTPYQQPDQQNASTGIRPQLLNAIDEAEASRLVSSAEWCMQEKKDGKRLLVKKESGKVHGINRRGLSCGLPVPVVQELLDFEHDFILDGEIVDDTYFVFDLLLCEDRTWMLRPYQERLNALEALFGHDDREHVLLLESIYDQLDKVDRLREFQKCRAEGVVFRQLNAPYQAGRPNSGGPALKYKFTTTASCIVGGLSKSKRSVKLVLFDAVHQKDAGNVTIPPNFPMPSIGDVVEVRYLYAFKESGALFQPVYLGRRDDLGVRDCTTAQLKFKQEGDNDDQ
ncbi:MAG TPA: WGR domain-containing protein [Candidatus Saccharimonadales bacterium]|nr:WGR domain-containing protein [Candidatus Saccharimonadales bacterium]